MNVVATDDTGSLLGAYSLWKVVVTVSQSKLVRMGLCVLWFTIAHMPCEAMEQASPQSSGWQAVEARAVEHSPGESAVASNALQQSVEDHVILAADTDELDDQLFQAVGLNDLAAVQQLLARGANVNAVDYYGDSVLHEAVYRSGNQEMVSFLLDRGANVNAVDHSGDSVLHIAAVRRNQELASLLVDRGASVTAVNNRGNSVLHTADFLGNQEMVSWLVGRGASVTAVNNRGNSLWPFVSLLVRRRASLRAVAHGDARVEEDPLKDL